MKQIVFALLALMVLILGAYFYLKPVFKVNGDIVFRREFEKNVAASLSAQQKFKEKYPDLPVPTEVETEALLRLLEIRLIREELRNKVETQTLKSLLQTKVQNAYLDKDFTAAAQDFYGLTLEEVKNYIILPQAEEDILKSHFTLQDQNFGDWLIEAQRKAQVKMYLKGFKWNGEAFLKD